MNCALEFTNNYLSIDLFAEHKEISVNYAKALITEGAKQHEKNVNHFKSKALK